MAEPVYVDMLVTQMSWVCAASPRSDSSWLSALSHSGNRALFSFLGGGEGWDPLALLTLLLAVFWSRVGY